MNSANVRKYDDRTQWYRVPAVELAALREDAALLPWVEAALLELHEAESAKYPPHEAGQDAQTEWCMRKARAHDAALAVLAKVKARTA